MFFYGGYYGSFFETKETERETGRFIQPPGLLDLEFWREVGIADLDLLKGFFQMKWLHSAHHSFPPPERTSWNEN